MKPPIPPRRVRELSGLDVDAAVRATGVDAATVRSFERNALSVPAETCDRLVRWYLPLWRRLATDADR